MADPTTSRNEYLGFGECAICFGVIGRYRVNRVTIDRCLCCGREWQCRDGQRKWELLERGRRVFECD